MLLGQWTIIHCVRKWKFIMAICHLHDFTLCCIKLHLPFLCPIHIDLAKEYADR